MSHAERDPTLSDRPHVPSQAHEATSWIHTDMREKTCLAFRQVGMRFIPHVILQPPQDEFNIATRQQYLLGTLRNYTEGINISRVHAFFTRQGLHIAPYRLLNEADTAKAISLGELKPYVGIYNPPRDIALVPRYSKLDAINGPAFSESVLVHELAHGSNEHHDRIYRNVNVEQNSCSSQLGRNGQRVFSCRGHERGRFLEEAYAERMRGWYIARELGLPRGLAGDVLSSDYFVERTAKVDPHYTVLSVRGKPHVLTETFAAQTLDHLCQIDPELDADLNLARKSAEGLRNVAKRIDAIKPGLYVYLRDTPYSRAGYRQRLIYVQMWLWHKRRHPAFGASG